jgi:phycocyanin-associated rod linker protein
VLQGAKAGRQTRVRLSNAEYFVSYEQLSQKLQEINRQGGKVTSITRA